MKRLLYAIALVALAVPAAAQARHHLTLAANHDLDGAASSATAIHSADTLASSTSYTIDTQPDTPRPLATTVVNAGGVSDPACTLTVVGTLADGTAATATAAFTAGGTVNLGPAHNFATVTSSSTGVCTGVEAGDTISLGTTSTIPAVFFLPRGSASLDSQGRNRPDPPAWNVEGRKVKTTGSSKSLTSNTASDSAFARVVVGDILLFTIAGEQYERVVATKTDSDNITVDKAIDISDGLAFRYRTQYRGPDDDDGAFSVSGYTAGTFVFLLTQIGNTVDSRVLCRVSGAGTSWVTVNDTEHTAAGTSAVSVDFRLLGYNECRAGLQFATSDVDGDAGAELEIITVQFVGTHAAR